MTSGQTWYVEVRSSTASPLQYNLTVQTVAAPSPAPSPGFMADLTPDGPPITIPQLPLNSYVHYRFSVPASSSGWRVELQPSSTTDADLYFSRQPPSGSTFLPELQSELSSGVLDTITLTPTDAQWVPGGGPYFLQVKAYTQCAYSIRVVLLGPSPSPLAVFPTASPAPGTLPEIRANQPLQAQVNSVPSAASSRVCYRYRSSPASGEFALVVRQMDNLPLNASVYWAWPPSDRTLCLRVAPSPLPLPSPAPGFTPSVTARMLRSTTGWLGYAGEYVLCAESAAGLTSPATFRLSVSDLDPSTSTPSPRALALIPLPQATVLPGPSLEWGGYRFYAFDAPIAGAVSFRLIPTRQATGTTGGAIQEFHDAQQPDLSQDWWVTKRAANIVDGHLTLTNGRGQRGFAWAAERKAAWPSFAITFDFAVFGAGGADNGEGMCFTLHNDPRGNNAEGGIGDGLGLGSGGVLDGPSRITRSVGVCVDTYPGTSGAPFPNRPESKWATYVIVDGNFSTGTPAGTPACGRSPALTSGCAFPLPDLSVGSNTYSLSLRITRLGAATSTDAAVHWSIVDAYTGVALGSWQRIVPNYVGLLNLPSFSNMAIVGFTAGTSTNFYSVHTVRSYYWGAREQLWNGLSGGNADLYVSVSPPTSPDSFSMANTQSTNSGVDVVQIDPSDSYYRGAGGRYYVAVYCAGPSGCTYTLEGLVGNPFPSMTPTPAFGIPSASPTAAPSLRPEQRLTHVNLTVSRTLVLPPYRASYFSYTRHPGYFGPITFYVDILPPAAPLPSRDPSWAGLALSPDIAISLTAPACPNGIFGGAGVTSCSLTRDVMPRSPDQDWITLTPDQSSYPTSSSSVIYIEIRNRAPTEMGASGNMTLRLRVAHDAGPPSGAKGDGGATGIAIAVVVAAVVVAGVVMGGLIVMKRMKRAKAAVMSGASSSSAAAAAAAVGGGAKSASSSSSAAEGSAAGNPLTSPSNSLTSSRQAMHNPYLTATSAATSAAGGGAMPPPPPPVAVAIGAGGGSRAAFGPTTMY